MKGLSEMVFFDENNEIIRAVQPKFNRVVVWNGSLTYMTKPVDYDNFNLEHSLWIRLSKDPQKYANEMEYIMVGACCMLVSKRPNNDTNLKFKGLPFLITGKAVLQPPLFQNPGAPPCCNLRNKQSLLQPTEIFIF